MKQSELLDEAVERKATLQDEINDLRHELRLRKPETLRSSARTHSRGADCKKKVIKSTFRKRASLRLTETRSSVFAKLGKLSSHDLLKLSEQCSAVDGELPLPHRLKADVLLGG